MLVYKLVKVNPTTLRFALLRAMTGSNVNTTKKTARCKKKSRQQLRHENRHGQRQAHSTAKPFCNQADANGSCQAQDWQQDRCQEGIFETIVDNSLDIHRMTCV